MAERLGEGLQNPLRGFDSHSVLHLALSVAWRLAAPHAPCQPAWILALLAALALPMVEKVFLFFVRLPLT